ncbi:MAG: NTP transferase domain-containing protein [Hungatella sp.]|jgi:molybdate transport repressor ModE-like protein|nr:NTP transferase domain-containing protein [Hungatella sp.]MDR2025023.1 NTP transferase domain-containing protein [Hungatella sp.]
MKTGAVIFAAGHKSATSTFKPLMPIGGTTVIRRIIMTLKRSGVDPIVVITGKDAKEVEKHISKLRVICLRNENYENTQMFDSICTGLNYIEDLCGRVLILPAKFPMLLPETIKKVMNSSRLAACPVFDGRRGHPIMISKELIPSILSYDGRQGLRGAFKQMEADVLIEEIPVDDKGIIESMETDEVYGESRDTGQASMHPTANLFLECDEIFFGPGIAQFLTLIEHNGSMQTACRQMNMSYSKGWKIIKEAEKQLGYPLLITRSGGAEGGFSQLTPKTKDFLNRFLSMEKELNEKTEELFMKYFEGVLK